MSLEECAGPAYSSVSRRVAEHDRHTVPEGDVRRHHAGVFVDPWKQHAAALIQALVGLFVGGLLVLLVFAGAFLRDNHGVGVILESLQAVDVIGMIVAAIT